MVSGRKPIPTALKIARGTYRKDRDGEIAPPSAILSQAPDTPTSLGKVGKKKWAEVCEWMIGLNGLQVRFLHAIERYCEAWDRLTHWEDVTKKRGEFFVSESGYVAAHPSVGLAQKARDDIRRYQVELGLTPSAQKNMGGPATAGKSSVQTRKRG